MNDLRSKKAPGTFAKIAVYVQNEGTFINLKLSAISILGMKQGLHDRLAWAIQQREEHGS